MNSPKRKKINAEDWVKIRGLLESVDQLSPNDRARYYVKNAIPKPLREEVEKFLSHQTAVDRFLEAPLPNLIAEREGIALELKTGETVGGFKLIQEIGRGSFATVYLAEDLNLGRRVALKVSRGSPHEAKLLASLEHDRIVRIFSQVYDPDLKLRLVCMQLVTGSSMDQIISKMANVDDFRFNGEGILVTAEKLSVTTPDFNSTSLAERNILAGLDYVESILYIGAEVATALDYAHSRSVLHLDVKPSNVLLTPYGRPLLADFNVSISGDFVEALPEEFGGTLDYMSPEQKRVFESPHDLEARRAVGPQSDVFSLGVVLREWISLAKAKKVPEAFSPEIETVLRRATAPEPKNRFPSAAELAQSLRACMDLIKIKRSLPKPSPVIQFSDRHPLLALTLIGAAPQLLASLIGIYYNRLRIISNLSIDQRALFDFLNFYINPIIFTGASLVWVMAVSHAIRPLADSHLRRKRLLKLPAFGFVVTTACWLPAAVLYAVCLQNKGNGLGSSTLIHLFVSFGHSWVIAASYSFLFHSWIVLRSLYPYSFLGEKNIADLASRELANSKRLNLMALRFVVLIPLIGAALYLGYEENLLDAVQFQSYRYLGVLLVILSGCGVFVASSLGLELQRIFLAFSKK